MLPTAQLGMIVNGQLSAGRRRAGRDHHDQTERISAHPSLSRYQSGNVPVMVTVGKQPQPGRYGCGGIELCIRKAKDFWNLSLYVDDVARSAEFYRRIFGFRVISDFGGRGCALHAGDRQVLLLFKKGASVAIQSPHDGTGELHLAFAIPSTELARWEAWLAENGITVEEKRTWELGGVSLYFRDPDRHLIEVATSSVWTVY